jgi:TPR repeat protein
MKKIMIALSLASIVYAGSDYMSVNDLTPAEKAELANVAKQDLSTASSSDVSQTGEKGGGGISTGQDLTIAMDALEKGDFKTAFAHFKIAAEQGDPIAQQNLAVMYNNGYGTQKNTKMAAYWVEKSSSSAKVAIK